MWIRWIRIGSCQKKLIAAVKKTNPENQISILYDKSTQYFRSKLSVINNPVFGQLFVQCKLGLRNLKDMIFNNVDDDDDDDVCIERQ